MFLEKMAMLREIIVKKDIGMSCEKIIVSICYAGWVHAGPIVNWIGIQILEPGLCGIGSVNN